MRVSTPALAFVLLAAGLAGCLGGDEASDGAALDGQTQPAANDTSSDTSPANASDEPAEPVDTGPNLTVAWFNGSVRGQDAPMLGPVCIETCDNQFSFEVPNATQALVAEVAWEAEASLLFDVDVPYETCEAGTMEDCPPEQASGSEGHLEIRVTDEAGIVTGKWTTSAWAEDRPVEPVDFTIVVTQSDGELPSEAAKLAS
jgi:hypothetical protein